MDKTYERLSNFQLNKEIYYPKRPNSCEKPRNKSHVFSIDQKVFCGVPVIDYSRTFQFKQKPIEKNPKSLKTLKKIKFCAYPTPKKTIIQKSAYKLPNRSNNISIVRKSIVKQPNFDKFNEKDLVKVLKKSMFRMSISNISSKNDY